VVARGREGSIVTEGFAVDAAELRRSAAALAELAALLRHAPSRSYEMRPEEVGHPELATVLDRVQAASRGVTDRLIADLDEAARRATGVAGRYLEADARLAAGFHAARTDSVAPAPAVPASPAPAPGPDDRSLIVRALLPSSPVDPTVARPAR
jgi:hypothetical protein